MKAGVFWDTDSSCYFPEKYDPCQVRQIIESAFKDFLPLTISAIGDLKRIPHPFLEPILSNGIFAKHCDSAHINIMMDMNSWRDNNAPPATIILISDREDVFEASGVLPSLRDLDYKTIVKPWKDLFSDSAPCNETTSKVVEEIAWVCDICIGSGLTFAGESFGSLIRHFDSVEHIYLEYKRLPYSVLKKKLLICEEEEYEEEDSSSLPKPTGVWWDIDTCLVPIEVDPYQVRQCIDSALKNHLPFTISAIGNLERLSSDLLEPILSSGIFMRHGKDGAVDILKDIDRWALNHSPPATIILISDREEVFLTKGFLPSLSDKGYTIIRAFQQHPKVSPKYASQTLLWEYLLSAGYEDTNQETTSMEICIVSGCTVEHKIQEKAITMAKPPSEEYELSEDEEDFSSLTKMAGVWWDTTTCHVPRGHPPDQVVRSIQSAFSKYLPFTISAFANEERIPGRVFHWIRLFYGESSWSYLPVELVERWAGEMGSWAAELDSWARRNPPPATLILISDREKLFVESGILSKFKERGYTIIRAFQQHPKVPPKYASQTILWDYLLSAGYEVTNQETISTEIKEECSETAWVCHICIDSGRTFAGESYDSLTRHFKSVEHRNQAKAITMAKSQSEVSTNVKNQSMASGNTSDIYLLMV